MKIGKYIFYDNETGAILLVIHEQDGLAYKPTPDEYVAVYPELAERYRNSFDVIELEYGQYSQDFLESNGNFRVNPETKTLEFSYPDPNAPEEPQPYQAPLSEEVKELKQRQEATDAAVLQLLMEGMM